MLLCAHCEYMASQNKPYEGTKHMDKTLQGLSWYALGNRVHRTHTHTHMQAHNATHKETVQCPHAYTTQPAKVGCMAGPHTQHARANSRSPHLHITTANHALYTLLAVGA